MKLFADLLTTDYGLVAVAATVVSLALAVGMRIFIVMKLRESDETHSELLVPNTDCAMPSRADCNGQKAPKNQRPASLHGRNPLARSC